MRRWIPVHVALGVSLGVVLAYLIAGGASYTPLAVADPCEPRDPAVLAERGVFEGILLSGLDGAACELGVTREELVAALADEAALDEFAAANGIDRGAIEAAARAGLIRAIDDAESQGRLPTAVASIARATAENAPISLVIDLFEALPGDPSLPEVIEALGDFGVTLGDLGDVALPEIEGLLDDLGGFGDDLGGLAPDINPEDLDGLVPEVSPENLPALPNPEDLLPEGVDPGQLEQDLQQLEDLLG